MANEHVSAGRKRMTLVLPERSVRRLNALMNITEASSYTEVLKNALRLYEAMIEEAEKGNEILVKDPEGRIKTYKLFGP